MIPCFKENQVRSTLQTLIIKVFIQAVETFINAMRAVLIYFTNYLDLRLWAENKRRGRSNHAACTRCSTNLSSLWFSSLFRSIGTQQVECPSSLRLKRFYSFLRLVSFPSHYCYFCHQFESVSCTHWSCCGWEQPDSWSEKMQWMIALLSV